MKQDLCLRPAPLRIPTLWLGLLCLLHVLPFAMRPALISGDEPHFALMAHSIATDADFDVRDEYDEVERGSAAAGRKRAGTLLDRHVRPIGDRDFFAHSLGLPLFAAPLLALQQAVAPGSAPDLVLGALGLVLTFCALLAGWRLLAAYLGSPRQAAFIVFGTYFSSPLWYYSRTFFTEPYTWSWAVLALASLARQRIATASLFLALMLAMKETALLVLLPVLLGVGWRFGARQAAKLAVGPAIFGGLFLLKNVGLFGDPFITYQPFLFGSLREGALGLLFDPRQGLLWFAPFLVVGAASGLLSLARRGGGPRWLVFCSLLVFAGYFIVTALWIDWRGGDCYGPRLLVPALPALATLLAVRSARDGFGPFRSVLAAGFIGGFTVQWCAALDPVPALGSPSVFQLIHHSLPTSLSGVLVGAALLSLLARFPETGRLRFRNRETGKGHRRNEGGRSRTPAPLWSDP